jgi:hypothetical protein
MEIADILAVDSESMKRIVFVTQKNINRTVIYINSPRNMDTRDMVKEALTATGINSAIFMYIHHRHSSYIPQILQM